MKQNSWSLRACLIMLLCQTYKSLTVQVCRSKYCCRQAPFLLETISDLIGAESVDPCSCLSHCETVANAQITIPGKPPFILHDLKDGTSFLAQVEMSGVAIPVPKILGAAAKVMEWVQATKDPVEQERLLNSVITKLAEDSEYQQSTALARAYSLRARARADQKNWTFAMEDAKLVVLDNGLRQVATDACLSTAYRVWADAEDKLNSGKERVVAVLQHWQKAQPLYRTKLQREMQNKWTK